MSIRKAQLSDIPEIKRVTRAAFTLYRENTRAANMFFAALTETDEDISKDIREHLVLVTDNAEGGLCGSIRAEMLTPDLAYVYRFAVDPGIHSQGVGASLLGNMLEQLEKLGAVKVALHTNSKYYKLARYYYGKGFYVHSTTFDRGYIRALFLKDLKDGECDISPAFIK